MCLSPLKFFFLSVVIFNLSFVEANSDKQSVDCTHILEQTESSVQTHPQEIPERISYAISQNLQKEGMSKREARGYAVLVTTMVVSAAATTYLTSSLPKEFMFLSQFLAQVSTIGVYVLGAPIWEPLSSKFRKLAFGIRGAESNSQFSNDPELEKLWRSTQENYSLNSQMSRNLMSHFILSIQQNFYQAYQAMKSKDPAYAADQIAQAAYRMRVLFKDVSLEDSSVAAVIKTSFTNHIKVDMDFTLLIKEKIEKIDKDYQEDHIRKHYDRVLEHWLVLNPSSIH